MLQWNNNRPDSVGLFKPFWFCWRLLGVLSWQKKDLTIIYDIIMNFLFYICYPVHLTVGLLLLPMQDDIFKNISMTLTCIVCSLKHYCIRWKLRQMTEMLELFAKLDERVKCFEERKYFATYTMKIAKLLAKMYFSAYMGANVAAIMSLLWDSERRLMYPAWFPFDWTSSTGLYYLAIMYQAVGITILIVINFTSDALCPVTLCLLSGHVHLLAMRVARLGYDTSKSHKQHEDELKLCTEDHIKLLKLFSVVENSLSYVQLILFVSSGLNICVVLVYLVFYVENLFSYIYYASFLLALGVELFPIYYFGSLLQDEFYNLPYAIFSSNWHTQTRSYRRTLVIFAEVTLRSLTMLAGGIVEINLDSFFAICKMAYSLFAVVMRIN